MPPDTELDAHYADAYGIFADAATEVAVLRVAPHRARWVGDEVWHPPQLGPDVEVCGPAALRKEVARRPREASGAYEGTRRERPAG